MVCELVSQKGWPGRSGPPSPSSVSPGPTSTFNVPHGDGLAPGPGDNGDDPEPDQQLLCTASEQRDARRNAAPLALQPPAPLPQHRPPPGSHGGDPCRADRAGRDGRVAAGGSAVWGSGKTVAAVRTHQRETDYTGGRFFLSMEGADFTAQLASLGRFFGVPDQAKPTEAATIVRDAPRGGPVSLLNLDNIVDAVHWKAVTETGLLPGETAESSSPRGPSRSVKRGWSPSAGSPWKRPGLCTRGSATGAAMLPTRRQRMPSPAGSKGWLSRSRRSGGGRNSGPRSHGPGIGRGSGV